jgi:hypothetical protein
MHICMLNSDMHVLIHAQDTCTYIRIYVYTYRYASSKSYSTDAYEYNQILADTYSTICNVPLCDVHVFVCICAYVVHMLCIYAHIFILCCMYVHMYVSRVNPVQYQYVSEKLCFCISVQFSTAYMCMYDLVST